MTIPNREYREAPEKVHNGIANAGIALVYDFSPEFLTAELALLPAGAVGALWSRRADGWKTWKAARGGGMSAARARGGDQMLLPANHPW